MAPIIIISNSSELSENKISDVTSSEEFVINNQISSDLSSALKMLEDVVNKKNPSLAELKLVAIEFGIPNNLKKKELLEKLKEVHKTIHSNS